MKVNKKILICTELLFLFPILIYYYCFFNATREADVQSGTLLYFLDSLSMWIALLGFPAFMGRLVDDVRDDFGKMGEMTTFRSHLGRVFLTMMWIGVCSLALHLLRFYAVEHRAQLIISLNFISVIGTFLCWIYLRKRMGLKIADD